MLFNHVRTHLVVAPSTSVGKSIFSTGLVRASGALHERVTYLKPVGTGTGDGDDQAHVARFAPQAATKCLFHFDEPVSPHLAVERARQHSDTSKPARAFPTDDEFAAAVAKFAAEVARDSNSAERNALYIESAGGVHSPVLSGTSQLDAFRPLLPPTILIASHELGGISTTISAFESLHLRGYDVDAVLVFKDDYYENYRYLTQWFADRHAIKVAVVDKPPERHQDSAQDVQNMHAYYSSLSDSGDAPLQAVVNDLQARHEDRIRELKTAPRRTLNSVWWPFVQHGLVENEKDVMVIDSAHGDHFSVFKADATATRDSGSSSLLEPMLDGSASWWTQCLGHANPTLTLAAAHASGRYGHVMFPTATNAPALTLAERLLTSVGQGWASRVFFSDDGSTGMEVGLKMALRAFAKRQHLDRQQSSRLSVLGLQGSYHGDTIGAMDACEGSVYSDKVDWYKGRGFWLSAPTLKIENGEAVVQGKDGRRTAFESLDAVFDVDKRVKSDDLTRMYKAEIEQDIADRLARDDIQFGALVLEPVVMGAGGMVFVDPLYQRVLIDVVRTNRKLFPSTAETGWQGLPVIFDEVFVGLRRLGRVSASTFLGSLTKPDIACYAKILTGGLVPMAVTLATSSIFDAFMGKQKVDALLHGHSYTAHAIGCSVANKTLAVLDKMDHEGSWNDAVRDWSPSSSTSPDRDVVASSRNVWSLWSSSFVNKASKLDAVEGVMSLGCVLAIYLRAQDGAGYESKASASLLSSLRHDPISSDKAGASPGAMPFGVHARPLGNVVYFMSSLTSKPSTLRAVEERLLNILQKH
ncbi:hypothetical protein ACM66B_004206 [Microbotryomycetes sp. NB124-2]